MVPTPSAELDVRNGQRRRIGNLAEKGSLQLEYARLAAVTRSAIAGGCRQKAAAAAAAAPVAEPAAEAAAPAASVGGEGAGTAAAGAAGATTTANAGGSGGCARADGYWDAARTFSPLLRSAYEPEGLNGGLDSFYEYVLKLYLLGNRTDVKLGEAYRAMASSIRDDLVHTCDDGSAYFGMRNGRQWQEHLACFAPGMLALGVLSGASGAPVDDTRVAIATGESCYRAYARSPTGLAPDAWGFGMLADEQRRGGGPTVRGQQRVPLPEVDYDDMLEVPRRQSTCSGQIAPSGLKFSLRPETIESLFYLYRLTRNETYREYGWRIFEAMRVHCRTPIGYAGILDTTAYRRGGPTWPGSREDSEPSFFMAEVLKYLYLLFADDDLLPLDDWVLNTEAHPFRIEHHPTDALSER